MAIRDQFGEKFLRSVLESRPGTAEELSTAKKQIDQYFQHLEAKKASLPKHSVEAATPPKNQMPARVAEKKSKPKPGVSSSPANAMISLYFLFALAIFALLSYDTIFVGHSGLVVLAFIAAAALLPKLISMAQMTQSSQKVGKGNDQVRLREKEADFDRYFKLLVSKDNLRNAYEPAEECLSLLKYLQKHTSAHGQKTALQEQYQGNEIDPVHTLIELLIDDHQLERADRLSRLYLHWLNPDLIPDTYAGPGPTVDSNGQPDLLTDLN
jgi:hypothetical protein